MKIQLNGEPREVLEGLNIEELLRELGLRQERVAVERNREIVKRGDWPSITLAEGDHLEVVHFVGGG